VVDIDVSSYGWTAVAIGLRPASRPLGGHFRNTHFGRKICGMAGWLGRFRATEARNSSSYVTVPPKGFNERPTRIRVQRLAREPCLSGSASNISRKSSSTDTRRNQVGDKRAATPKTHWSGKPPPRLIAQGCLTPLNCWVQAQGSKAPHRLRGARSRSRSSPARNIES